MNDLGSQFRGSNPGQHPNDKAEIPTLSDHESLIALNNLGVGQISLLRDGVKTPKYDRDNAKIGVVHIGPGFFFRALIAPIMDEVMAKGDRNWGISTVEVRRNHDTKALNAQNGLYTLVERNGETNARIIGSIMESHSLYDGEEARNAIVKRMANPDTKLFTMTITEAGYNGSNGEPAPAVKLIVDALELRHKAGSPAPTVMSCDNIVDNGKKLRDAVIAHAEQISSELKIWIENNVKFPSTMVDRITPSTDKDRIENPKVVADKFAVIDPCAVVSETYRRWVIEDKTSQPGDIPNILPTIDGVNITDTPGPMELAKIRSLNGAHVAVGMIGHLTGHILARDAMQDENIKKFIIGFVDSALTSLPSKEFPEAYETAKEAYARDTTISRIANTHLEDQLTRLPRNGRDGKIQSRVVASSVDLIGNEGNFDHHAFVIASWFEYLKGIDANGNEFDISDKKAIDLGLQTHMRENSNDIGHILNDHGIFDYKVRHNKEFNAKVAGYYQDIQTLGMKAALAAFNEKQKPALELKAAAPALTPHIG